MIQPRRFRNAPIFWPSREDVALRSWLNKNGLRETKDGGDAQETADPLVESEEPGGGAS